MSAKVGRNDPCPCGSGKKYKRCHLPLDQQAKAAAQPPPALEKPNPALLRDLVAKISKKESGKTKELLANALEVADYMERSAEIEAAGNALEPYREEFTKLLADEKAARKQAEALFQEERFAPLWFTPEEVRRGFKHAGGPPNLSVPEETVKKLRAAILFLADKEKRPILAMSLVKHMPDYVKAGRFMDAWLIQHLAHATSEFTDEPNLFLFEMFSHGYETWASEKRTSDMAVMRQLGLDPDRLTHMSMEEIDAWVAQNTSDPAKLARLETLLQAQPEVREQAEATQPDLEREFETLLATEEGRGLLLTPEEVHPWLPKLMESWQKAAEGEKSESGRISPEGLHNVLKPILGEMAQAVFTPERIATWTSRLSEFRQKLFEADKKGSAICLIDVASSLKKETEPGKNYFLIVVCFVSLRAVLDQFAQKNEGAEGEKFTEK